MNRYFCFYTHHYADYADRCIKSFAQFSLEVTPVMLPKGMDWMICCMQRSAHMLDFANQFPNDGIGLLDADLTCLKEPLRLKGFNERKAYPVVNVGGGYYDPEKRYYEGDIAVHDLVDVGRMPDNKCERYSAGVTCFAPTAAGRACLKLWSAKCQQDALKGLERLREQVYLYESIQESKARVFNLGRFYNCPIDENYKPDETVILHHVASRELRSKVGGEI